MLRIISTIAVIFIHVNFHYFEEKYLTPSLSLEYIVENFINVITRFSVPVFVMLSGGFNLCDRNNSQTIFFYRKVLRKIVLPATIAALIFFIIDEIKSILLKENIFSPLIGLLSGFYALWFLYMLVGLYLLTPFVIKLKSVISRREYIGICIFMMLWAIGSQVVSNYKLPYTIGTIGAFLGYYIMGDILMNYIELRKSTGFYFGVAVAMFCISWFVRYRGFTFYTYVTYRNFFSPAIVVASLCVFAIVKKLSIKKDFSRLSHLTFYIYIFHTIILNAIFSVLDSISLECSELILIPIVGVMTFLISLLVAIIYDKIWNKSMRIFSRDA